MKLGGGLVADGVVHNSKASEYLVRPHTSQHEVRAMLKKLGMLLEKQEWFRNLRAYRDNQVYVVDGDAMFNRPGPRLVDALEWLHAIMHAPGDPSEIDFPYVKLRRGGT